MFWHLFRAGTDCVEARVADGKPVSQQDYLGELLRTRAYRAPQPFAFTLLRNNIITEIDACVADAHGGGSRDDLSDFILILPAKGAHRSLRRSVGLLAHR
jgi:hypothetical protein